MPNAAGRVVDITPVPRYDMNVQMKDGLAGRSADIDADIEAVRLVTGKDSVPSNVYGRKKLCSFTRSRVEPCCNVSPGYKKRMSWTDWKAVP
jgi:hypothetical protein